MFVLNLYQHELSQIKYILIKEGMKLISNIFKLLMFNFLGSYWHSKNSNYLYYLEQ